VWPSPHSGFFFLRKSMRPTLNRIGGARDGEGGVMAEERAVVELRAVHVAWGGDKGSAATPSGGSGTWSWCQSCGLWSRHRWASPAIEKVQGGLGGRRRDDGWDWWGRVSEEEGVIRSSKRMRKKRSPKKKMSRIVSLSRDRSYNRGSFIQMHDGRGPLKPPRPHEHCCRYSVLHKQDCHHAIGVLYPNAWCVRPVEACPREHCYRPVLPNIGVSFI
jgi:hypothetical protein